MTAARTFIRNTTTTRMTSPAPSSERREQVVERLLDEVGLPEQIAVDLHALRQRALDVVERRVDPLGQLQRVHPGCFWMPMITAGVALCEPSPRLIAAPSRTVPTSRTRTGAALGRS